MARAKKIAETTESVEQTLAKEVVQTVEQQEAKAATTNDAVQDGEIIGGTTESDIEVPITETTNTVAVCSNYPRDIKFKVPDSHGIEQNIIIRGNAGNLKGKASGIIPIGAYGITVVDADAWAYIEKNYKDAPYIRNGLMFASKSKNARAAIKERTGLRHGFEPVDPETVGSEPLNNE